MCCVLCCAGQRWLSVMPRQTGGRAGGQTGRPADHTAQPTTEASEAQNAGAGVGKGKGKKKGGHGRRASRRGQGVCLSPNPQGNFHTVRHSIGFAIVVDEAAGAAASRGGSSLGPMRSILRRLLQVPEVPTPGVGPQTHDGMLSKVRVEESGPLGSSF